MNNQQAVSIFESLASGIRLDIFRLLVRAGLKGMVAGDIAAALNIAPNNLSFHLKTLAQSGMVSVEQEGRFQRYHANIPQMLEMIAYLTAECCSGHPEECAELCKATPECR